MNKFIFTFGSQGTGKSTMLACLADFITSDAPLIYDPRNLKGAEVLFRDWLEPIEKKSFPKFSETGQIYEVDIVAQDHDDEMIPITFLEMSGEDLVEWDPLSALNNPNVNIQLQEKLSSYLIDTEVFLIVTDYRADNTKARDQDSLIVRFLNRIITDVDNAYVLLVVTKWDLSKKRERVTEYVKSKLKRTYTFLDKSSQISEANITSFTIGDTEVKSGVTEIIDIRNDKECQFIIEWLLNYL
jgi:energy-coupling factor transporter ATP-binding protein EcfA2